MSIGVFLSVRSSYVDSQQEAAQKDVAAIQEALAARGLPAWTDIDDSRKLYRPFDGRELCLGRSTIDTLGSGSLGTILGLGAVDPSSRPNLNLLVNSPRTVYVPVDLARPISCAALARGRFGSVAGLRRELTALAPPLGIPLGAGGVLSDDTAVSISRGRPLFRGDTGQKGLRPERVTWLVLFEATAVALEHRACVVTA